MTVELDEIKKLKDIREKTYVLLNIINRAYENIVKEIEIATEAKETIDELIYELTGDEFYHAEDKGGKK